MLRYAVRALPWSRLVLACGLLVLLVEVVREWPGQTWALLGTAIGVLAGAAAWAFDEPAARVVDVVPRSLVWRTAARLLDPVLLLGVWAVALVRARPSLGGLGPELFVAGASGVVCGIAWTTWRRSGGEASPGTRFATLVIPVATAWALAQPLGKQVPVFPSLWASPEKWSASTAGWSAAAAVALVVIALALGDARWWRVGLRERP